MNPQRNSAVAVHRSVADGDSPTYVDQLIDDPVVPLDLRFATVSRFVLDDRSPVEILSIYCLEYHRMMCIQPERMRGHTQSTKIFYRPNSSSIKRF